MICASLKFKTMAEVVDMLEKVPNEYDLVEIWINEIQDLDVDVLKEKTKNLLLIKITDASDKALLDKIFSAGFNYVDIDLKDLPLVKEYKDGCKLIGSYHDFESTPTLEEAKAIVEKIHSAGADIAKVVFFAKKCEDNFIPLQLLKTTDKPLITFCMGDKGRISRFLGVQCGSLINYVAPEDSWKTAEGQFTMEDWRKIQTVLLR